MIQLQFIAHKHKQITELGMINAPYSNNVCAYLHTDRQNHFWHNQSIESFFMNVC